MGKAGVAGMLVLALSAWAGSQWVGGRSAVAPPARSALSLRQASLEDWPAIEEIFRRDPRVVATKERLAEGFAGG